MKTSWRSLSSSSSRHLNQDEYIRLSCTFSEDVFIKTNIFVLAIRLQGVFRTFSKDLQGVLQKRLEDIFKTFSRPLQNVFRCLTGLKVGVWLRVWNIELLSWKIYLTSFLKKQKFVVGQQTEWVFMRKQPSEGLFKKSVMRNLPELTRKHLYWNLFFDKVKLCRSATSLKTSL